MKAKPLISIIVNCFNGEKYLREALDSIYRQTYENWEIIFFDNQSNDSSSEIANSYDSRLKYHYNKQNDTLGEARRLAVKLSKGDWIAFLDCDDAWVPDKLERQIECIKLIDDVILVYAGIAEIDESGVIIRTLLKDSSKEITLPELLNNFDINMVTPIINRKKLFDFGLNFNPGIEASEEYNLFMQIAAHGKVFYLNECLGYYRVYENSLTNKKIHRWSWERIRTIATLLDINPQLLISNYEDVLIAIHKGIYYHSCFLASKNDFKGCREFLRKIRFKSGLYFILYFLSYFPTFWMIVHSKKWKSKLISFINHVF